MNVQIDVISANGQGVGEFAREIVTNGCVDAGLYKPWMDPTTGRSYITVHKGGDLMEVANYENMPITTNALLRQDEWKEMDRVVLKCAESRLGGVQDLKSKGLVMNIGNGMGTTVFQYQNVDGSLDASLSMDGVVRGQSNRPVFGTESIPLPICHVDYEMNDRVLQVSRKMGSPLDTSMAELAARAVAVKLEEMLFTDTTYFYGSGTIYSYVNHPYRNQVVMTEMWDAAGKTGLEILTEVISLKTASIAAHHYGPWVLYIPVGYETKMDEDFSTVKGDGTIRERLLRVNNINAITVIDTLPEDNVLLVEMTTDVVRWINGMAVQNVQWTKEAGLVHNFKVMTIQVPQIRSDKRNQSGLVHLAPAASS